MRVVFAMALALFVMAGCGSGVDQLEPRTTSDISVDVSGVITWEFLNAPDLLVYVYQDYWPHGLVDSYYATHGPYSYSASVTLPAAGDYRFTAVSPFGFYSVPASQYAYVSGLDTVEDIDFVMYQY
jgi:hypothetical protein